MPRPPSTEARDKMLRASAELLMDEGVLGFTVDEVSRRSGVAKTTIYRHFPTRNELLVAAVDGAIDVPETPDTGNLRDDVAAFLRSVRPIFADTSIRTLFFDLWSAGARDPELQRLQQAMMAERAGPTMTIYRRGLERGEISPDIDYPSALEVIEGPFIVRSLTRPEALADLDIDDLADRIAQRLRE